MTANESHWKQMWQKAVKQMVNIAKAKSITINK
jgi:hypothetical protein